jgi:phosphoglycerol transferase MdoB-like AlkP superfamily enzyme
MVASDLWLWLDLVAGGVIVAAARQTREHVGRAARRVVVGVLVVVIVAGLSAVLQLRERQPEALEQVFRRLELARQVGVINVQARETVRWALGALRTGDVSDRQLAELVAWFEARAPSRAGTGPWFGAAAGRNLVMVQVESLQGFVVGLEVAGQEVTPFLNAWRSRALWFSNVTDQTLQGRSSDSELASQTSLLPAAAGAAAFRFAANDYTGLAEILAGRGYRTLSAVPYEGDFWNRRATHRAYGYQTNLFRADFAAGEKVGWGLSDRDFLDQMVARLRDLHEPYAAYLLTLSLHHPFEGFPEHLKVLDVGRWQGTPFGNFLHTMHYFDASLAKFVAELDADSGGAETMIAVWGDHDAGFEWRPEIAAAMGVSADPAGWYLSQEVPLFVRVPGLSELTGERTVPAGHADIAPTLLALLGVDPAPYAFVGRNLLGTPGSGPVVGEYGCWRDDQLLFLQGDGSLAGGRCLELATMKQEPTSRCAGGWEAARRTEAVSSMVLEHDLQSGIHQALAATGGGLR